MSTQTALVSMAFLIGYGYMLAMFALFFWTTEGCLGNLSFFSALSLLSLRWPFICLLCALGGLPPFFFFFFKLGALLLLVGNGVIAAALSVVFLTFFS